MNIIKGYVSLLILPLLLMILPYSLFTLELTQFGKT